MECEDKETSWEKVMTSNDSDYSCLQEIEDVLEPN